MSILIDSGGQYVHVSAYGSNKNINVEFNETDVEKNSMFFQMVTQYFEEVLLKTSNSSVFMSILIDSSVQNTHVSGYAANELKLRKIKTEKKFRGIETSSEHNRYKYTLINLDFKLNCEIHGGESGRNFSCEC